MPRGRALSAGRLFKRGRSWTLDFRGVDGRRHIVALSTDKHVAERARIEIVRRRDMERCGLLQESGQDRPLAELVALYISDLKPRVCARHAFMVSARLQKLLERLGPIRVGELRALDVTRVRNEISAAGASPRTANLTVDSLNACLRWAEQNELVARNVLSRIKRLPDGPAYARRRRRALSDDECARLLAAAAADDDRLGRIAALDGKVRVPQAPLFRWLLALGTRYGETVALRWADVDFEQAVVALRAETTKSRRQRLLPLSDELISMLRGLQATHARLLGRLPTAAEPTFRTPEGAVWSERTNNVMRVLSRLLRRAGIKRVAVDGTTVDLHALRHTAASALVRRGVNIVHVQRLLGHADLRTTSTIYTHVDTQDLRRSLEGAAVAGAHAEELGAAAG